MELPVDDFLFFFGNLRRCGHVTHVHAHVHCRHPCRYFLGLTKKKVLKSHCPSTSTIEKSLYRELLRICASSSSSSSIFPTSSPLLFPPASPRDPNTLLSTAPPTSCSASKCCSKRRLDRVPERDDRGGGVGREWLTSWVLPAKNARLPCFLSCFYSTRMRHARITHAYATHVEHSHIRM
jgi:hypothetical protein